MDQALFATLNVKHHCVHLWGLANRVVVLDEVHAYDAYTSELIAALLRWLKVMGSSVVLMSATLPDGRQKALLEAWGALDRQDIPYPRVLMTCGTETLGRHVPSRPLAPIHVSGIDEGLEALADAALANLRQGGCGVVILNTVQRAQDLYLMLDASIEDAEELLLFHARFPADERGRRERAVLERFGPERKDRRPPRTLLIATQVVEQSLDLDFDFMLSDLAPIDLLLQRAGRLHRHRRERPPAHKQAILTIAGLVPERPPELADTKWGYVYDPYILFCSWQVVGRKPLWTLPTDIDGLVQAVYSQDPFEEEDRPALMATLDQALGEHYAETQRQRQLAMNVAIDARNEPHTAYNNKPRAGAENTDEGIRVVTRLGPDSIEVVPMLAADDGWRLVPTDAPFLPDQELDDALAQRIFARQLRVSRKDIIQALRAEPVPNTFDKHPLLRNLRPMVLRDGKADFGTLHVRLDPELGLVYETSPKAPEKS